MADHEHENPATSSTGQGRRRARTHAALLDAGRQLLGEGRENASIEEITGLAGVGFGSFTNHFPQGKAAFFTEAAHTVLSEIGTRLQAVTAACADPAEAVATGFCATVTQGLAQPHLLRVLLRSESQTLFVADTLRTAAHADIQRGMDTGIFQPGDATCYLTAVGSILLGTLRLLDSAEYRDTVPLDDHDTITTMATTALCALGVTPERAGRTVTIACTRTWQ